MITQEILEELALTPRSMLASWWSPKTTQQLTLIRRWIVLSLFKNLSWGTPGVLTIWMRPNGVDLN